MKKVFVSGCYDILHAGHIDFFRAARRFGDHLTVCFANDEVYRAWKGREPSMPEDARRAILEELRCIDKVVVGHLCPGEPCFLDFKAPLLAELSDILITTEDDANYAQKLALCCSIGIRFQAIPKPTRFPISTTLIRERLAACR